MTDADGARVTGERAIRKVIVRLLPLLMLCYLFAFIDRVNLGFAALQMNRDVQLGPAVIGIGGRPVSSSATSCSRCRATWRWRVSAPGAGSARIMVSWGLISAATAFVSGTWSFLRASASCSASPRPASSPGCCST